MSMLSVEQMTRVYGNTTDQMGGGIRNASIALEAGQFFTLLGPSGCGKTTTLRCIAGLETPDIGTITIDGKTVFDSAKDINLQADRRAIGMVFQSYAIWPHMTVAQNVAFPFAVNKAHNKTKSQVVDAVKRALAAVNLDGYQQRPATRLSGGEQQRVALARAIVHEPRLLLLDEPLSNLDAQLRDEMRAELKRLQSRLGITSVYVTHDQQEAMALSDRIAVLSRGKIVQIGTPEDVYFRPVNAFVAGFVGATNLLDGSMIGSAGGAGEVQVLNGRRLRCLVPHALDGSAPVSVSIRPETISIVPAPPGDASRDNVLTGRVTGVTFFGPMMRLDIVSDGVSLQVNTANNLHLPVGQDVLMSFPADQTVAVPKAT